jgi:hypothetical protein
MALLQIDPKLFRAAAVLLKYTVASAVTFGPDGVQ